MTLDLSDEDLMHSYQQGNFEAFETLYGRYAGRVYGYLRKRLRNASVDDVHQTVFLKLHESRFQYKKDFKFAPWLFVITRTVMLDSIRKVKNLSREIVPESLEGIASPPAFQETSMKSFEGLETLSESQKKILEMRYDKDMEFEAIARELNISHDNVRQQVSRAIKKLRRLVIKK